MPNVTDSAGIARTLSILQSLMTQPATVGELAKRHNVDQRTIRRDLLAIRNAGFPLRHRTEQYNRRVWRVVRSRIARKGV